MTVDQEIARATPRADAFRDWKLGRHGRAVQCNSSDIMHTQQRVKGKLVKITAWCPTCRSEWGTTVPLATARDERLI